MTETAGRAGDFERLVVELRPKLHHYCARMTGSAIDGEDVVQNALLKAYDAQVGSAPIANPEGWLFRIAHNAALDFLRRRSRDEVTQPDEVLDMIAAPEAITQDREIVMTSLRTFMRLPAPQRSAVILKDVLGHSLEEVAEVVGGSLPAAKSALQRGRARLRELAQEPDDAQVPVLPEAERVRLTAYVEGFNAGEFDTVRQMLADDVQLDLVTRFRARGRQNVGEYLHRYALADQWRFAAGFVDGRPAMLVFDRHDPARTPAYFVALDWAGDEVVGIRDFLFARYAMEGVRLHMLV